MLGDYFFCRGVCRRCVMVLQVLGLGLIFVCVTCTWSYILKKNAAGDMAVD